MGPNVTPVGGEGSAQGKEALVDSGEWGELPNPVPPIVDDSDSYTVEKL